LPDLAELIPIRPITPIGEPILIKPFEEVEILRRTYFGEEVLVLVSCRNRLYLITESDLETRTIHEAESSLLSQIN
jgi:hypothetical protein